MFAHRLALALGEWDVDGLLDRMSARQFAEWAAFYVQDPWGERRADLRSALSASALANLWRSAKSRPVVPLDFMPYEPKPPIAEDEIERKIETFMMRYSRT